jgi:hypothetical protein
MNLPSNDPEISLSAQFGHRRLLEVLSLGPTPEPVRALVRRLVADDRPERRDPDERLNGFVHTCGPGGCS